MIRSVRERLGGIGDEAASAGDRQVALHAELGLAFVELRTVGGVAIADLSAGQAEQLAARLAQVGLEVGGFASRIGNWARTVVASFDEDRAELTRLARLAPIFGTRAVRVMTYGNGGMKEADYERHVLLQFRELGAVARSHGLRLLVENCTGWAASDPARFLAVREAAGGDVLRLLFDVGNPVAYGYDGFAYLQALMPHVGHIHVKDARRRGEDVVFTLPGDGDARLVDCIRYALDQGYEGLFSLEPHLKRIPHLGRTGSDDELADSYRTYVRRFLALVHSVQPAMRAS